MGVGTDLASIPRFARAWQRHGPRLALHILAPGERVELETLAETARARFLARRWAAKEALVKAAGSGFGKGLHARGIAVVHDDAGAPSFALSGRCAERLVALGEPHAHLSISDDGDYALAFVVLARP